MSEERRAAGALATAGIGTGAAAVATVASACCVGPVTAPLVVGILGAGGAAWAAGLEPYSPYLLTASGALLTYPFWALYRPRETCHTDEARTPAEAPWARRLAATVAWTAALVWVGALVLNLLLP